MYSLIEGFKSPDGMTSGITRVADGAPVPLDPNDPIYQEYLAWVAEGGIPRSTPCPPDLEEEARKDAHKAARDKMAKKLGFTAEEALALFNGADDDQIPVQP